MYCAYFTTDYYSTPKYKKNTAIVRFIIGSKNVCLFSISMNNHEMALCVQHVITSIYCRVHGVANQCTPWDSRSAETYYNDELENFLSFRKMW